MMKTRIAFLLLLVASHGLAAQEPIDSGGGAQAAQLRQQIRQRWNEQVRRQLNLTDDQAVRLQATEDRFFQQRREVQRRQRAVLQALRSQLQPGVEADADSVRRLLDARDQNRGALAQLERDEDKETTAYLSPVQRARYQLMRQRLQERIAEMRRQRRGRMGPQDP
jgi:Spy/CpxP family protein refolding chaperone